MFIQYKYTVYIFAIKELDGQQTKNHILLKFLDDLFSNKP